MVESVGAPDQRSPFQGLGFYTEADAKWFFGRVAERKIILSHLRTARLTLLYAESGVGKSSLLRAGVAARLRQLAMQNIDAGRSPKFVPVVFSSWKDQPVEDLISEIDQQVRQLVSRIGSNGDGPFVAASSGPDLRAAVGAATAALDATLVVILDQFEEHFRYRMTSQRPDRLAEEIAECVNSPELRANFLIAVREDAYGGLADVFSGRISNLYNNYLHLEYLTRDEAREAIEKPVAIYNAEHSDDEPVTLGEDLADAVLDEVRRGNLDLGSRRPDRNGGATWSGPSADEIEAPFLQLVMTRLWEVELASRSRVLRRSTLDEELGGAETIVRNHVSRALTGLAGDELETATDIFGALVTPSGTKVAHTADDLAGMTGHTTDTVVSVVRRLYEERILRAVDPAPGAQDARFEIFHDRLAAPILDWRDQQESARVDRAKLRAEAEARTQRAQARRFKRRARITLALAAGLLLLLVAVIVLLQYARDQSANANRERRQATYFGLTSRAQSQLAARPDVSLLLYLAAYGESPQSVAERSLVATLNDVESSGAVGILHGHTAAVDSIAFSPIGSMLASAGGDKTIRLWTVTSHGHYPLGPPLRAGGPLYSVAFDPTGQIVAAGSFNKIDLWSIRRHTLQAGVADASGAISSLAFSPRGNMLAAGAADGTVLLWNTSTHRGTRLLVGSGAVRSIAFSPDGAVLAVSKYGGVALWNVASARKIHRPLTGQLETVYSVAFSPDGNSVAAGGGNGTTDIWNLATGKLTSLRGPTPVNTVAFSTDGRTLAVGSGAVTLWDLAGHTPSRETLTSPLGGVFSVAFSPDGRTLAAAIANGTISLWDYRTMSPFPNPLATYLGGTARIAISPDDHLIASGGQSGEIFISNRRGTRLRVIPTRAGQITDLVFKPATHVLAASSADGTIRLWDALKGTQLGTPIHSHQESVSSIAFDRTGTRLVSGGVDGTVRIWDVRTHSTLGPPLRGNLGIVFAVAFSPTGREVASGGDDKTVRLWDARTYTPLGSPLIVQNAAVFTLAFSADGRLLAAGGADDTIHLWNVAARPYRSVHALTGNLSFVRSVAFSPDGHVLASAGSDKTVRLWDVITGNELGGPLMGHGQPVESVDFSSDGSFLASGSDSTVRLWQGVNLPRSFADLRKQVCDFVGAGLSTTEWSEYAPSIPYHRTCPRSTPN